MAIHDMNGRPSFGPRRSVRQLVAFLVPVVGMALAALVIVLSPDATSRAQAQAGTFDLALQKGLSDDTPTTVEPDENVVFTITVFNQGDVTVPRNTVTIIDYIPAGWTLTSSASSGWAASADGTTASRLLRVSLAPGDSEELTIRLRTPLAEEIATNWAEISVDGASDLGLVDVDSIPDTANGGSVESPVDDELNGASGDEDDHDFATIEVLAHSDISVTKFANGNNNATAGATESITPDVPFEYWIDARNLGPSDATNVVINDQVPAGVTLLSADDPNFDVATGTWTIPALPVGDRLRLKIAAEVTEANTFVYLDGLVWNTASLTSVDQVDDEPNNDAGIAAGVYEPRDRADLELAMTVDGDGDGVFNDFEAITVDTDVTTRATITNNGPGLATSVGVNFQLAPGISGGDQPQSTPYIKVGESVTFEQVHQVNAADQAAFEQGPGLVWAQVGIVGQDDPDSTPSSAVTDGLEDDEDSAALLLGAEPQLDLELDQIVPVSSLYPDYAVEWTLSLRNRGVADATGVLVQNETPPGLVLDRVVLTSFDLNTGVETALDDSAFDLATQLWSVGTLPIDTIINAELRAKVLFDDVPTFLAGGGVNGAQVTATQGGDIDSDPGSGPIDGVGADKGNDGTVEDDETTHQFFLSDSTDLNVDKVVDGNDDGIFTTTEYVYLDEPFIWRLAVTNESLLHDATGVMAHDLLPDGITLISADSPDFDITTGVWTVGSVPVGETVSVDVVAVVKAVDEQAFLDDGDKNWLQITAADQDDRDSDPSVEVPNGFGTSKGPDGAREDDEASARVRLAPVDSVDLEVFHSIDGDGDGTFGVSENIDAETDFTWRITVVNEGLADGTGVALEHLPPPGTTLVSASDAGFDTTAGAWIVGNLPSGATATVDVVVRVSADDQAAFLASGGRSWAQVTAADQDDVDSDPETRAPNGTQDDEDSSTARLVPLGAVDLEVVKGIDGDGDGNFASSETITVGEPFVFKIEVTNTSSTFATGVELVDYMPEGVTVISADVDEFDIASGVWSIGTVPSGGTLTLNIVAEVTNDSLDEFLAGSVLNWAQITTADQPDSDSDPGTDAPDGRGLDRGGDGRDEDDEDSARPIYVDPSMADLSVTKTIDGDNDNDFSGTESMVFDTPFTWRVEVTNDGPAVATNIEVADYAPAGVTFTQADDPNFDTTAKTWSIPTLAVGQTAAVDITAIVSRANLAAFNDGGGTNWAEITAADQLDPDSSPGTDTADGSQDDEDSAQALLSLDSTIDLSIVKTIDGNGDGSFSEIEPVSVGIPFTWQIAVTNDGPETATGVVIEDYHPAGAIITDTDDPRFNPATNIWTIAAIAAGETQVLNLTALVTDDTHVEMDIDGGVNWAEVTEADQLDPDSLPGRNTANGDEDDEDDATAVLNPYTPQVDLQLSTTIDGDGDGEFDSTEQIEIGRPFVWNVTVSNVSPANATGVTVEQRLPIGLTDVSVDVADYDPQTGFWTIGFVPANGQVSMTVNATVTADSRDIFENGSGTHWAQIAAADQVDPDSVPSTDTPTGLGADRGEDGPIEDDEASARAIFNDPEAADLEVRKLIDGNNDGTFANSEVIVPGISFDWQVTVTNNGDATATNVEVTDHPPLGLTLVAADQASFDVTTGRWAVGTLAAGQTATLVIETVVDVDDTDTFIAGDGENWAEVSASDQVDPDSEPGTNTADGNQDDEDEATALLEGTVTPTTAPAATTTTTLGVDNDPQVDLGVVKTNLDPLVEGEAARWSLTVVNLGPDDDPGPITVTDNLPPTLSGISATGDGFICSMDADGSTITCIRAAGLQVDETATVIVTTRVDPDLPLGTVITNQALVASAAAEQTAANNAAAGAAQVQAAGSASTTVPAGTVPPTTVPAGTGSPSTVPPTTAPTTGGGELPFTGRGLAPLVMSALVLVTYGINLRMGSRRPSTGER